MVRPTYEELEQRLAKVESQLAAARQQQPPPEHLDAARLAGIRSEKTFRELVDLGPFGIKDAAGRVVGHSIVVEEITARKEAEEALAAAYGQIQSIVDNMPAIVYAFDLQGRFVLANASLAGLLQSTPEQMIGKRRHEFMPKEDADWHEANDREAIAAGAPVAFEENSHLDGRLITWLTAKFPLRDGSGSIHAVAGISTDISERKQAEVDLTRARNTLAEAQKIAHLGSFEYIVATQTTVWSEEEYRIYGLDLAGPSPAYDELLAKSIHPDDVAMVHETFTRAMQNRSTYELEHRIVRPDGSVRWVYDRAHPYFDENGTLERYVGATLDITERIHGEETLRQRAEEVERLLEVVPAAVWVSHDPECRTLIGNRQANEFFEVDADENVSPTSQANARRFFAADGREVAADDLPMQVAARTDREIRGAELHVQLPSGRRIAMIGSSVPLHDEAGEVRGCIGAFLDITKRIQTEHALQQINTGLEQRVAERTAELTRATQAISAERQRLFDVLETVPTMIYLLREDHTFAFANRSFREHFGSPEDHRCHELCFGLTEPCEFCESFEPLKTGRPHFWEVTVPGDRVFDVHDFPFTDTDGTRMILEMDFDITERRHAEAEVQAAHAELAALAGQLRALAGELTLSEQRERRRMAKLLHDHLQQLLVGAKFRVAVLGRHVDPVVQQAAQEVEQLLDESVQASRSLTAELSPPILHEGGLIPGLEWLARWMGDKHGLLVDLSSEPDVPSLAEDAKVLLFESVRELLFNAVKHAKVGWVSVNVRSLAHRELRITVSDSGSGFDPNKVRNAGMSGGGFGLFSIRERLGLIGGRMEIYSSPGKGSRFMLTMPIPQAAEPPAVAIPAALPVGEGRAVQISSPNLGAPIRVLLADDHVVMREGLARLLGQEPDIEIIGQAADGEEAVRLACKLLPNVILMDMSMPKLTGVEATRAITTEYRDIRIIGLSMFQEEERAQALRDAGGVNYLTKSGPADQLIDAIRKCMNVPAGEAGPAKESHRIVMGRKKGGSKK